MLEAIRLYCDVALNRSFSRAAEIHGVSQSAVSQRIMVLERRLGVQLIDRSSRPLRLTDAGESYFQGCRRLLERYEKLEHTVRNTAGSHAAEVNIAAIYSAGIGWMNQTCKDFQRQSDDVRIYVGYAHPDDVLERVKGEKCDFGVLSYPDRWRGVQTIPLRDEPMVAVWRAGHDNRNPRTIKPADLNDRPMVGFEPHLPIARQITEYLRRNGARPAIVTTFDNVDTIRAYISQTDALAILPRRTVRREIDQGTLTAADLDPMPVRPMGIVLGRGQTLAPAAEQFMRYLREHQPSAEAETQPDRVKLID